MSKIIAKAVKALEAAKWQIIDGRCISTEILHDEDPSDVLSGKMAGDYYGEFRGGYSWISPEVKKIIADNGCIVEWKDPGTLIISEA